MVSEGTRDGDFLKDRGIHDDSNVWSATQGLALMLILGLSETIDQLAMTSSVRWYGRV